MRLVVAVADMLDDSFEGDSSCREEEGKLLDHQPLKLNQDDHQRVLQIPIEKACD